MKKTKKIRFIKKRPGSKPIGRIRLIKKKKIRSYDPFKIFV